MNLKILSYFFLVGVVLLTTFSSLYAEEKKIASIGLRISNGYSYHGISINVDMDLAPFSRINPCGYQGLEVTQMKDIHNKITLEDVKNTAINKLNNYF